MSDFLAEDIFDAPREEPKPEPKPEPDAVIAPPTNAGKTFWFESETPFAQLVLDLQQAGDLPVSPLKLPLPYLSVSQVELYLRCPLQFYHRYIKGEKRPPGIAMVQGTTIHKAVEEGYKKKKSGSHPELDFVLEAYSGTLDQQLTNDVIWEESEDSDDILAKDKGKVKDQGVGLLKKWHKDRLPIVTPQAVEKSFVTSFNGIPVVGRIDLVDRVDQPLDPNSDAAKVEMHPLLDVVVDNKVVGKTYPKAMVDNKMQMSLYAHATGLPQTRYDLFVKTKVPKLVEMMTSRDAQQIRWAVHTFTRVAQAIAAGNFPPCMPEAFNCSAKWCGYYSICRGAI